MASQPLAVVGLLPVRARSLQAVSWPALCGQARTVTLLLASLAPGPASWLALAGHLDPLLPGPDWPAASVPPSTPFTSVLRYQHFKVF